jgi:hypothetical protein
MKIDHYGQMLVGCLNCNRWGHPGDDKLVMELLPDDLRRPQSALYSTAPLAAWLGELDAPGASYHGRAAGKVSNIREVVRPVLRHHHHRQDYHYHSERDELGRHCVLQEVR